MNINDNLNNQITPGRQAGRTGNTRPGDRVRTPDTAGQTEGVERTVQYPAPEQVQDTVSLSDGSRFVDELSRAAEEMADTPREDLVASARQRVVAGEYNSPDVIRRIAQSLLDTTFPSD